MLNSESFLQKIEYLQPCSADKKYLLAISGGADSMALLNLFSASKFTFQVAHVNYKLRGLESDLDQELVENFCSQNNISLHIYEVSNKDEPPKNSVQTWARKLRYAFFKKIKHQENLEFLVTAHHLNDDLETFFINLSRGSGLKGLSGIPSNKNNILRPFLHFSKQEIYDYCAQNEVPFREDASNKKNDYLRNKIRNEIVPKLLETNEHYLKNFQKSILYLKQNERFIEKQIADIEEQILINEKPDKTIYDREFFAHQEEFVKFEILRKFGFVDIQEIEKIFLAKTGKSFFSERYHLLINRNEIILKQTTEKTEDFSEIIILTEFYKDDKNIVNLKKIISEYSTTSNDIFLEKPWEFDAEKINLPLKLRHWKSGDKFYPAGMFGSKKVSKFFKDEKISLVDKEEIWLLVDGNDDILGIIPYRQDRRFIPEIKTAYYITIK
ncbi:tRNA lysidine(34) synthetase TilS [Frigoriflavimonas asaccharolytica]|uniref:tRNA(Ile)-lysidine synthase n=1 Tax=Frigoriflavimonas asaccharolytica TaxID=2735899 RepID=A0A8J8G974_9FLAO|nr:tRNA lysidine(34) synthetase TilS [Frigoriflavimonas asaccharolytica]NRS93443.1 tRNA(Ile)-lysidine synthase [Frigoriflavimonas asaccharolytica]